MAATAARAEGYGKRVLRLAFSDSLAMIGVRPRNRLAFFVTCALGILALWAYGFIQGGEEATTQAMWFLARGLIFVAIFPVAFLWCLLAAPSKLDKQRQEEITTLTIEIDALKSMMEPRLEIVFGEGRPYLQERDVVENGVSYRQRHVRVGIKNCSSLRIHDARFVLEGMTPGEALIFPEHMLQVMDIPKAPGLVDINPGATRFFDVACEVFEGGSGQAHFYICYVNTALIISHPIPVSKVPYRFTVRAECESGAPKRAAFFLTKATESALLVLERNGGT